MATRASASDRIGGIEAGLLVRYADGVLTTEQTRAVESAMRDNPEAAEALARMRHAAAAVRHAFDEPLGEPMPERLRKILERRPGGNRRFGSTLLPLAASIVALLLGLGGGYFLSRPAATPDADIRLAAAQDGTTSGAFGAALLQALAGNRPTVRYSDDESDGRIGKITLLGAVETSFGTGCREFRHVADVFQPDRTMEGGLACRRGDGSWEVTILTSSP